MKKFVFVISMIFLHMTGLFCFRYQVYFGPDYGENIKTLDQRFIDFIDRAEKSIDGAFFEIRMDSIAEAFIAAKARGVKVRLMTDSLNYENKWCKMLKSAGIVVKDDEGRSGLMHNKFCVVDGTKVWTGSYNLTDTGSYNNYNNGFWIFSKELAEIYTAEFNELYVDRQFGKASPSDVGKQTIFLDHKNGKVKFEVLFAPEDDPNTRIAEILENAKKSIYFMQFAFTEKNLADIMVKKFKNKIEVKGIMDKMLYSSTGPYSEFFNLTNSGISVNIAETSTGKFHHKVFIVDYENEEDATVIIGSGNASINANNMNDENIMIIHCSDITRIYFEEFKRLFGRSSNVRADVIGFVNEESTHVKNLKLIVNSNGSQVGKVSVQFPARWDGDFRKGFKVSRCYGNTTSSEDVEFTKNGFIHHGLGLKPHGEDSYVIYTFGDFVIPDIQGGYSFYIQTSPHEKGVKMMPLKEQPGIEINVHNADDFMADVFSAFVKNYNAIQLIQSENDYNKYLQVWNQNAKKYTTYLINKIKETNDYTDVRNIVALLKKISVEKRSEIKNSLLPLYWFLKTTSDTSDDKDAAHFSNELHGLFFDVPEEK